MPDLPGGRRAASDGTRRSQRPVAGGAARSATDDEGCDRPLCRAAGSRAHRARAAGAGHPDRLTGGERALLRLPGGLEGFLDGPEHAPFHDLTVVDLHCVGVVLLDSDSGLLGYADFLGADDHPLARFAEFPGINGVLLPAREPVVEVIAHAVPALVASLSVRFPGVRIDLDFWTDKPEQGIEIAPERLEALPHDLNALLRHRPRSISRRTESDPST